MLLPFCLKQMVIRHSDVGGLYHWYVDICEEEFWGYLKTLHRVVSHLLATVLIPDWFCTFFYIKTNNHYWCSSESINSLIGSGIIAAVGSIYNCQDCVWKYILHGHKNINFFSIELVIRKSENHHDQWIPLACSPEELFHRKCVISHEQCSFVVLRHMIMWKPGSLSFVYTKRKKLQKMLYEKELSGSFASL